MNVISHIEDLSLKSVSKIFHCPSKLVALKKVSHIFSAGSFTVLTGSNGAGKSTLLRIVSGLSNPDEGKILGINQKRIGYFSANLGLYGNLDTLESLKLFTGSPSVIVPGFEVNGTNDNQSSDNNIKSFLGVRRLNAAVRTLSKGQQVRLALLIALVNGKDLLLLDEPTTHLDKDGIAVLNVCLSKHVGTVILATHEPEYFSDLGRPVQRLSLDQGELST